MFDLEDPFILKPRQEQVVYGPPRKIQTHTHVYTMNTSLTEQRTLRCIMG